MADIAKLSIVVELKDGKIVVGQLDDIRAGAKKTEDAATSLISSWKKMAAALGLGIAFREFIHNIIEAQNAMAQLEAAVASTGGAAGRTVEQLDQLSIALQRTTAYSDETVKGAEAILLTFQQVKGVNFDRALATVTDLAARMGRDLPSAALMLGKALESPSEGLSVLQRTVGRFTEAQKLMLQQMVDTGHVAEAQAIILGLLEERVGGTAAKLGNTLGGALARFKNTFADMFEISQARTEGIIHLINRVSIAFGLLNEWFSGKFAGREEFRAKFNEMMAEEDKRFEAAKKGYVDVAHAAEESGKIETANAKAVKEANEALVRSAKDGYTLALLSGVEKEREAVRLDAVNKKLIAQRDLKFELLTATEKAIDEEAKWKLKTIDATNAIENQQQAMESLSSAMEKMGSKFQNVANDIIAAWNKIDAARDADSLSGEGALTGGKGSPAAGMDAMALGAAVGIVGLSISKLTDHFRRNAEMARLVAADFRSLTDAMRALRDIAKGDDNPFEAGVNAARAARDAAAKLRDDELNSYSRLDRNGPMGQAIRERYRQTMDEILERELEYIRRIQEELNLKNKIAQEDYHVRMLRAQGLNDEADLEAFRLTQQRELAQAIKDKLSEETIARLKEVQAMEAQQYAHKKLAESLTDLTATVEMLRAYSAKLRVQTAAPWMSIQLARQQFTDLAAKAMAGDQGAAAQLPGLAQQFLDVSRDFYASGAGYQSDLRFVLDTIDSLGDKFEVEKNLAQLQLDSLGSIQSTSAQIADNTAAQIDLLQDGFKQVIEQLQNLGAKVDANADTVRFALEEAD